MIRWWPLYLALLVGIMAILSHRAASPSLLDDSDTRVMLSAIEARGSALSWFVGDWPLANHFYRPISTLTFEADLALHGRQAAGFGLTNALLACFSLMALGWLASELLRSPWSAAAAVALYAVWHFDAGPGLAAALSWLWAPVAALAAWRVAVSRSGLGAGLMATLAAVWIASEVAGPSSLKFRVLEWIPGRTASTMTVFALVSLAAWVRFERQRRWATPEPYDPLEPPSGRNSPAPREPKGNLVWGLLAAASMTLALASYEQAVVVPAILSGISLLASRRGAGISWRWIAIFWALLLAYLALRWSLVSSQVSGYQRQQLRFGPGVWLSLTDYAFPAGRGYGAILSAWGLGLGVVFLANVQQAVVGVASNLSAYVSAFRLKHHTTAALWLASVVAFAPMAFLKPFDHYHYFPMALRALFVTGLTIMVGRLAISAIAPPARQAPRRLDPAPGSLPRP